MTTVANILSNIKTVQVLGDTSIAITALCLDSRKAEKGSVFFAVKGSLTDGHKYIPAVIESGAVAIVCQDLPANPAKNIVWIQVKDTLDVIGSMACNYYDNPSHEFKLVGVTGTNGKTTVASLLFQL